MTNGPTIGIKALRAADWHLRAADEPIGHRPVPDAGTGRLDGPEAEDAVHTRARLRLVRGLPGDGAVPDPLAFLFLLGLFNLLDSISRRRSL